MRYCCRYFIFLAAVCFCAISNAYIYNGGFEDTEPNEQLPFDPPAGWERENYAAVLERFIPDPCQGNVNAWSIDLEEGLRPVQGKSFVVLSTGDFVPEPWSASITQQNVYAYAGESISGYYFFGTADYIPYDDYATIALTPVDSNSGLSDITLVYVDVNDVDQDPRDTDGKSMEGWEYFEYTFSESEAGGYRLIITVTDEKDGLWPSYLAVDGLSLCNQPPAGDINRDCRVNFDDFSWLATDWLGNCNDPNYALDPNSNCYRGTDLDGNGPVDINDLRLMSDSWLW
jgi:hypothetical protein